MDEMFSVHLIESQLQIASESYLVKQGTILNENWNTAWVSAWVQDVSFVFVRQSVVVEIKLWKKK